jgi:hypothetical protein
VKKLVRNQFGRIKVSQETIADISVAHEEVKAVKNSITVDSFHGDDSKTILNWFLFQCSLLIEL